MRFKYKKQDGIKDCGACVLHNIIRYYNGNINFEKLRRLVNTTKEGTSVYHIVNAANKLGLDSKGYRCGINDLCNINFPVVAHLKVDKKYPHYVIIKKIVDDEIFLFDPVRGNIKYSLELFEEEWTNVIITFSKTDKLVNENDEYKTFIYSELKNNKFIILLVGLFSIIYTLLSCLNSFYLQSIIDNINDNKKTFILFMTILIISIIINYIRNNIIIKFNSDLDSKVTSNVYNHILNLPLKYHHSRPAGDIVSRIYDLYYVKDFINQISFSYVIDILIIIITGLLLVFINFKLYILLLLFQILIIFIYLFIRNDLNNLNLLNQKKNSKINSILVENLIGIDTIKNLCVEEKFLNRQNNSYNEFLSNNKKLSKVYNTYNNIEDLISNFGLILVLFVGSIYIIKGQLTIGSLVSFNALTINYLNSFKNLLNSDNLIINSKNAYERLNDLFSVDEEEKEEKESKFNKKIEFLNLTYSYNDINYKPNNFNFIINKNDFVLLTGKSGIGKSTIFKLLTKQLNCKENMIYLDNKDINKYSKEYLRNKICFVSQNEYLFTDTIENNIKLFNEKITDSDFKKALQVSMVDKILKDRNIDLNYILEENAHNLSGGERQKILLARTLLRNSDYIILDETMNEIDVKSERKIIKEINSKYNKTLILISHRTNNKDLFNKYINMSG